MSLWSDLSKRGFNGVLCELERRFGPNAGRLASQLLYYHTPIKTPVPFLWKEKGGYQWVAMTRGEFCSVAGLTIAKFKAALQKLEPLGIIYRTSGHKGGLRVTYLRLDMVRLTDLIAEYDVQDELQEELNGDNHHTGMVKITTLLIKQEGLKEEKLSDKSEEPTGEGELVTASGEDETCTENKLLGCDTVHTVKPSPLKLTKQGSVKFNLTVPPEDTPMNASDILVKKQQLVSLPPKLISAGYLAILWKKRMSDITGGYVKPLTGKDMGQLKLYLQAISDPEQALAAFNYAFANWGAFVWKARSLKGLTAVPEQPVIGFLLAHHEVLLQLIAQKTTPQKTQPSQDTVKSSTIPVVAAPVVHIAPAPTVDLASEAQQQSALEQMMALVKSKG